MSPFPYARPAAAAAAVLLLATLARPQGATAATWTAIDTVAGSGLSASIETWEATPVDYDGDGDQDVWIGYHDQGGKLWRNNGSGAYSLAFTWPRRNAEGKVPDRHDCDWADVDRNGLPDAYCAAGRSGANLVKNGRDNELWLQKPLGQFTDVGTAWGIGDVCGRSHYVAFLRANGDAWPDLFVGNASPRDVTGDPCDDPANGLPDEEMKLFINQSGTGFRQVRDWGVTGFGGVRFAEVADYNRDGWDDLLVSYSGGTILYRNIGGTGFTNVSSANGLATNHQDAAFGDLDRDDDPDLVTAAGRRIEYRLNNGSRLLSPVRAHLAASGAARAVSVGDADGDGDLDIYALYSNLSAGTNPRDVVLRNTNLQFSAVTVPAAGGVGDAVATLDGNGDGRSEFLVLNGVEVSGPIQRIELRLQ